ncbi:hypothetical protein MN608_11361 [Microdochium nivale]|nr:hypothetical protein MN608_11361 [Microdochium nivale]
MHLIISGAGPRGTTELKTTAAVVTAYAPQLRALKKNIRRFRELRIDLSLIEKQPENDRTTGNAFKGCVTLNGGVAGDIVISKLVDPTWPRIALSPSLALREAIGDPEDHAADLEKDSVVAAALVRHATTDGVVDTTRACTTRGVRGQAGKKQLDVVLEFVKTRLSDLMSAEILYGAETVDVNVLGGPSIIYIKDGARFEQRCDEINIANGSTNRQSISPAINVFDQVIESQNLRPFYEKNGLWTRGELKRDLNVLVHGAGLYGADFVAKILNDARHIVTDKKAPGGVALNKASQFKGIVTVQSRDGYIPPVRMEVPSGTVLFPRFYGTTKQLWAAMLHTDRDTPTEAREILHANIAYALDWHPDEVATSRDTLERITLYYRGMVDIHERPNDAKSYRNLGTLLHEGYRRLWNGEGLEADSGAVLSKLEDEFPIVCRDRAVWIVQDTIVHSVTSPEYLQKHGSNEAAMQANAEARTCIAAATPPVFAALALGVESGVVRHLRQPFSDDDRLGRDMVCSALMLTKSADTVNARIRDVDEVVPRQPKYTTGRHFARDGRSAPVRECGYGGHGAVQVNADSSTSHVGVRWLTTTSEDAARKPAETNGYINVLKAVLKAAGVQNPMDHIREEYLCRFSGTEEEFEREKRQLAPHGVNWVNDYAFLKTIRKHTHGNRGQYRQLFERGADVEGREALLLQLGGQAAVMDYRQISAMPTLADSISRTDYIDRFVDIPPRIAEQMLEDTLHRFLEAKQTSRKGKVLAVL